MSHMLYSYQYGLLSIYVQSKVQVKIKLNTYT